MEALRVVLFGTLLFCMQSISAYLHKVGGRSGLRRQTSKSTRGSRTAVKMTTPDSTPWSHTDSEQSLTWLKDGNRIEYLDAMDGSDLSSLADAMG